MIAEKEGDAGGTGRHETVYMSFYVLICIAYNSLSVAWYSFVIVLLCLVSLSRRKLLAA